MHKPSEHINQDSYQGLKGIDGESFAGKTTASGARQPVVVGPLGKASGGSGDAIVTVCDEDFFEVLSEIRLP